MGHMAMQGRAGGSLIWAKVISGEHNQSGDDIAGLYGTGFFLAAYDTDEGTLQWLHASGTADGSLLAWRGGCYFAGWFHGQMEIAGTKLKATKDGYFDLMVAKIGFAGGE
jgi:hypothetical protein